MTRSTFTRLVGLALTLIITTAVDTGIVRSQIEPVGLIARRASSVERSVSLDKARILAAYDGDKTVIDTPRIQSQSKLRLTPIAFLMRPCKPRTTIGGRLTRRTDVFGDEIPQYRPVKGEQVFLWNAQGDEIARTRTDRNGGYSFPNLCAGSYTVHPGIASPLLPSRYEPSSRTITVPVRINDVRSPAHLDFVRKQPPPPRQPDFPGIG